MPTPGHRTLTRQFCRSSHLTPGTSIEETKGGDAKDKSATEPGPMILITFYHAK